MKIMVFLKKYYKMFGLGEYKDLYIWIIEDCNIFLMEVVIICYVFILEDFIFVLFLLYFNYLFFKIFKY